MIPSTLLNRPFLPLATERLTLRPLQEKDLAAMAELANDIRVAQKLTRLPYPYTLKDAHAFLPYAQGGIAKGAHVTLAIIRRSDQTFMGVVGLEEALGYWLGFPFWGQGYGKEAVKALVQFGFLTLKQDQLKATALVENQASRRILEGVGFIQIGTNEMTSHGYEGTKPGIEYTLTRKDFFNRYIASQHPTVWAAGAALINEKDEFLITERLPHKGLPGVWELPGGKIEPGETPDQTVVRELNEELGIIVREEDLGPLTFASYRYDTFHLIMHFYTCRKWEGTPQGIEGQKLAWVIYPDLAHIPTPPGGIMVVHQLGDFLKQNVE